LLLLRILRLAGASAGLSRGSRCQQQVHEREAAQGYGIPARALQEAKADHDTEELMRNDDGVERSSRRVPRSAAKRKGSKRYGRKASEKVERSMHEMKRGKLRSGRSKKKVKSRKQAIAIGLSEARRAGGKVPPKKGGRKKGGKRKGSKRRSSKR